AASHADGLPAGYLADPAGGSNPLAAGPVTLSNGDLQLIRENLPGAITDGPDPVTVRDPDVPDDLPRTGTVARALNATTFSEFSTIVESIHNGVRGWGGGGIAVGSSGAYS